MFMIDVFISYEHESKTIADNVVSVLERNNIRCWYAPRDVIGDYATSICNAIMEASIFVVLMNLESSQSDHVLNEVEMAYKRLQKKEITILPFKASSSELSLAMEYYLKRLHWIDATSIGLNKAIDELKNKILSILGRKASLDEQLNINLLQVKENKYFDIMDTKEIKRLELQAQITQSFDQDVYDRFLNGRKNLLCVDFGSNDGTSISRRLLNRDEIRKIIGLEFNVDAVNSGNEKYKNTKLNLIQIDLEVEEIDDVLSDVLKDNNEEKIDIAVCSFILLHMKHKKRLLRAIKNHLSDDGVIVIADIEDGLKIAYPDENKNFERIWKINRRNEFFGFRNNGRTVFELLKKCGYENIKLEHCGLSTIGMTYEQREAMWKMCFSYIERDLNKMIEKYPENEEIKEDLAWWRENKDSIEEEFLSEYFFFMDSTMVFSARKRT